MRQISDLKGNGISGNDDKQRMAGSVFFLCLLTLLAYWARISGPADLMSNNEVRVAAYILDAVLNGKLSCQVDGLGSITSKPPLYTWISAGLYHLTGRINQFVLYFPTVLGMVGTSLALLFFGRGYFGERAAFLAAFIYIVSPAGYEQTGMCRFDGLFAFPVCLGALAAYRGWITGKGWFSFWLAMAAATLIKGPLGFVLAGGGLFALFWEKNAGTRFRVSPSHLLGILLFIGITGGWFWLAYREVGQALIDKMLGHELVGHAFKKDGVYAGQQFYLPPLHLLTMLAPWSVGTVAGLYRIWKRPDPDAKVRSFERFLFCWLMFGMLIFSLAAHHRNRLIIPLLPAAALIAGRELAQFVQHWPVARFYRQAAIAGLIFVTLVLGHHHLTRPLSRSVQRTTNLRKAAEFVKTSGGPNFPISYYDCPFIMQYYLNTHKTIISLDHARLLLAGEGAAFVAVVDYPALQGEGLLNKTNCYELFSYPPEKPYIRIVGNRPRLGWTDRMALMNGSLEIEMRSLSLKKVHGFDYFLQPRGNDPGITFSNHHPKKTIGPLRVFDVGGKLLSQQSLAPGERWSFVVPRK